MCKCTVLTFGYGSLQEDGGIYIIYMSKVFIENTGDDRNFMLHRYCPFVYNDLK